MDLRTDIEQARVNGGHVLAVFFDVEGATMASTTRHFIDHYPSLESMWNPHRSQSWLCSTYTRGAGQSLLEIALLRPEKFIFFDKYIIDNFLLYLITFDP